MKQIILTLSIIAICNLAYAQQNQNTHIAELSNGSFPVYKMVEKATTISNLKPQLNLGQ